MALDQVVLDTDASRDAFGAKEHTGDRWIAATALALAAPLLAADRIYRNDPDLVLLNRSDFDV